MWGITLNHIVLPDHFYVQDIAIQSFYTKKKTLKKNHQTGHTESKGSMHNGTTLFQEIVSQLSTDIATYRKIGLGGQISENETNKSYKKLQRGSQ